MKVVESVQLYACVRHLSIDHVPFSPIPVSISDGHRFIVHDLAMERQYRFNLQGSLQKALHCPMLQGYAIHVTKSVLPGPQQMAGMLEITCAFFSPAFYLSAGILSLFTGDDFMQQYLTKMLNEFCK